MIRLVDELNEDNPLHCTEYMEDIFKYMQESEQQDCYTIPRNYLVQHGAVSSYNRAVLVDWLVQVHMKLNLVQETLYIAIDVIDRFLKVSQLPYTCISTCACHIHIYVTCGRVQLLEK